MPFFRPKSGPFAGNWIHINTGRKVRESETCGWCGKAPNVALCDYRMKDGSLCSKPLCEGCREHRGRDLDFCPNHIPDNDPAEQQLLFEPDEVEGEWRY